MTKGLPTLRPRDVNNKDMFCNNPEDMLMDWFCGTAYVMRRQDNQNINEFGFIFAPTKRFSHSRLSGETSPVAS